MQMTINTSGADKAISEAITAIDNGCSYEELKTRAIMLISALSYYVGFIEGVRGEADDNQ